MGCVKTDWYALSPEEVIEETGSGRGGLDSAEAKMRLGESGLNELREERKETRLEIFLKQFRSVLILILIIATGISFILGEIIDAFAIMLIVILNAFLGYTQEWQAEKAIEELRKMLGLRAVVIRDRQEMEIDAVLLVPGDLVLLDMGQKVPADLVLLESTTLQVNEAALTGESSPQEKFPGRLLPETPVMERSNMAFTGTTVVNGWGKGIVVATGMQTEFGKIAEITQKIRDEKTPLTKQIDYLGRQIGRISILIAILIIGIGLIQQRELLEMFLMGVSLAVAVIPEGLPAVVTLTLALGIRRMMQKNCLIRHLAASETLGSVSVICTDKTGTLTRNEMTVTRIYIPDTHFEVTGTGYEPAGEFRHDEVPINPVEVPELRTFLRAGLYCNHAVLTGNEDGWKILGTPTEGALVVAAHKAVLPEISLPRPVPEKEFSFSSVRKRMTVICHEDGRSVAYLKGAPEVIIRRSTKWLKDGRERRLSESELRRLYQVYESFASSGLRVLALAYRSLSEDIDLMPDEVERDLVFLGFAGIIDPPRPEVKGAFEICHQAGIDVIMITGDSALTAQAVADSLGMESSGVLTGAEIDEMDDETLTGHFDDTQILARVSPEHKVRVIDLLNRQGLSVAMTGDGVNDAPALKSAQIGIAMGIRGTDVAKEASDMVLLDDNFASIVAGVNEGRREYDNILKFTLYLFSSNVGEVVAIAGGLIMNLPLILLPVQVLWINLVTDGVTALALGVEPPEGDLMNQKPGDPEQPLLTRGRLAVVFMIGMWVGIAALLLFMDRYLSNPDRARTLAFTGIIVFELINVLNFRSFRSTLRRVGLFSNPYLILAIALSLLLQLVAVYHPLFQSMLGTAPLTLADWLLLVMLGLPLLIFGEAWKYLRR